MSTHFFQQKVQHMHAVVLNHSVKMKLWKGPYPLTISRWNEKTVFLLKEGWWYFVAKQWNASPGTLYSLQAEKLVRAIGTTASTSSGTVESTR